MQTRKSRVSDERLREAILASHGNLSKAGKIVGLSRSQVCKRISNNESLQEAVHIGENEIIDAVESQLHRKALEGDIRAMMFFLERRSDKYRKALEVSGGVSVRVERTKAELEEALAKAGFVKQERLPSIFDKEPRNG